MLGDGDGNSPQSTASYAINHLPASWLQSANSPAKRHLGGAHYAFADGHVKWLPSNLKPVPDSDGSINRYLLSPDQKKLGFTFTNK
jgi:prepilin-type processing-associated H-X9-DG protein